jgi:hypothetical protein
MTPNRKTFRKITERALKKCTKFYANGVHARCTPAEYIALCEYFGTKTHSYDFYLEKVKRGDSSPTNHYFHVKKWKDEFPVNKYAVLGSKICGRL